LIIFTSEGKGSSLIEVINKSGQFAVCTIHPVGFLLFYQQETKV